MISVKLQAFKKRFCNFSKSQGNDRKIPLSPLFSKREAHKVPDLPVRRACLRRGRGRQEQTGLIEKLHKSFPAYLEVTRFLDYNRALTKPVTKFWVFFFILIFSFSALYYHTIIKMVQDWLNDDNYSHGFLIPVIAGYLIWQRRDRLSSLTIRPSDMGILFLIGGLFIFLLAGIGAEIFSMRFSMLIVIWGMVIYIGGIEMGKITLIPIAYLSFMIPLPAIIWNKIAFPLKIFATKVAVMAIASLNISVYREGNIIHLADTTLQVVDACSGLRSLASLMALSAAFALLSDISASRKWILFLSAVPTAILLNILRLVATALFAQYCGEHVAKGFLHEFSGILVFLFAVILLFTFHLILKCHRKTSC